MRERPSQNGSRPNYEPCVDGSQQHHWIIPLPNGTFSEGTCNRGCEQTATFRNYDFFDYRGKRIEEPEIIVDGNERGAPAELVMQLYSNPRRIGARKVG